MKNKIKKTTLCYLDGFLIIGTIPFLTKFDNGIVHSLLYFHKIIYYITIYLCLLLFIGSTLKGDKRFKLPLSLMVFFIFMFIQSVIFSNSKIDSLCKVLILLGTCVYGLSLIKRYKFEEILKITIWGGIVINIVTIYFMITNPALAFEPYKEEMVLAGSFPTKNNLATYMLFSVIVNLVYLRNSNSSKSFKLVSFGSLLLAISFLFASGSATSIATIIVILVIYYVNKLLKNKLNLVNVGILMTVLLYITIKLQSIVGAYFTNFSGRDLTLTGRTYIWDAIISQVGMGLIHGYGYGTFWGYNQLLEQSIVSKYTGYIGGVTVNGAHNGFLELMLQIGVIGTLIFVAIIIKSGKKLKKIKDKSVFQFSSFFYIYILIYFITERSLWNMGYQTLFIFIIIILTLNDNYKKTLC
ncbi:O-antigen ligase family protein [Priestia aryabhattai]|uniref:O-antigen ligase family protein n=1 Tax=Priestia aryabhattai TaxID=412384 RepID=UPI002E235081|nr:O-antigen ligase family protein [Priestia aryabhattai]